jgi:hypothetical protein
MATSLIPQEQSMVDGPKTVANDFTDDPVKSIEQHGLDAVVDAVQSLPEAKQPKARQSNLDALAAKVAKAGKAYREFAADEKAFDEASKAFAKAEDKWFKRRDSFKAFFFKQSEDILKLRSEFPSIETPGSTERLTVLGKAWTLAEFVLEHFGVSIQQFNKVLREYALKDVEATDAARKQAQKQMADENAGRNKGGGSKPRSGWKAADAKTAKMAACGRSSAAASSTPTSTPFVVADPETEFQGVGIPVGDFDGFSPDGRIIVKGVPQGEPSPVVNHQTVVNFLKKECGGNVLVLRQQLESFIRDIDWAKGKLSIILNT